MKRLFFQQTCMGVPWLPVTPSIMVTQVSWWQTLFFSTDWVKECWLYQSKIYKDSCKVLLAFDLGWAEFDKPHQNAPLNMAIWEMFILHVCQHCVFTNNESCTMAVFTLQLLALWKAIADLQMMMSLFTWQKPILPTMPACTKGQGVTTGKPSQKASPMATLGTSWKVRMSLIFHSAASGKMFSLSPAMSDDERAVILVRVEGSWGGQVNSFMQMLWAGPGCFQILPDRNYTSEWMRHSLLFTCFCALA